MQQARELQHFSVRFDEVVRKRGYQSTYALHQAMAEKGVRVTYRDLCRMAAGRTTGIRWEHLVKLCRFLRCQISDLFHVTLTRS